MGDNEVSSEPPKTYTEVFEEIFPYYLAIGMSYEQFWYKEPQLVRSYRKADEIRRRRMSEEQWLAGMYTADALRATVGNMFSKGNKYNYPAEPRPITRNEIEARKEREQREKVEKIKATFIAKALDVNKKIGGDKHDGN